MNPRELIVDGALLGGLVLLGTGIWWHDPGASLAVVGGILFVTAAIGAHQ